MRRTSAPTAVFISFRTTSLGIPAFLMSSLKPRASLPTSSPSLPHTDSLPVLTEPSLPRPAQLTASFPYVLLPIKAQLRGSQPEAPALLPGEREKKVRNKTQDHFTHRSHVQTLLFWDAIHLCNRAGISQTLLRPEICCQSHMQRLLPSALQSCGWPGFEDQNLNSQQGKRGMEGRRGNS